MSLLRRLEKPLNTREYVEQMYLLNEVHMFLYVRETYLQDANNNTRKVCIGQNYCTPDSLTTCGLIAVIGTTQTYPVIIPQFNRQA